MSSSNGCFLTCIQAGQEEAGKVVWYSHLFKDFSQFVLIHTVKGFRLVNETDVFLEFSCFFYDPRDVDNLISGSSAFSKSSLNILKFLVHIQLKPSLENFEHYFASMWNECYCALVRTFFGIAFLWDWNENWHFPVLWPLLSFPYLLDQWIILIFFKFSEQPNENILKSCPSLHFYTYGRRNYYRLGNLMGLARWLSG